IPQTVAIDFLKHFFNLRLGMLPLGGIIPRKRVQPSIPRTRILLCFFLQSPPQVIHEPCLAACVPGRIYGLLSILQESLRVGESAFFFRCSCCGKQKYFGADCLWRKFAPPHFRRVIPKRSGLSLDHLAHHKPLELCECLAFPASIA